MAIFLSWGSQVEDDERFLREQGGRAGGKVWLAAPVQKLSDIPEDRYFEDPETHEGASLRDIVRQNRATNYFYLPPFPDSLFEYVVDFRRICPIGIQFFLDAQNTRIATLTEESLNAFFCRLMWFFTRAEYFYQPIRCQNCRQEVPIDIRFHGQNFDVEPWE